MPTESVREVHAISMDGYKICALLLQFGVLLSGGLIQLEVGQLKEEQTELQDVLLELLAQLKGEIHYESIARFQYEVAQQFCIWSDLLLRSLDMPKIIVTGRNEWNDTAYKWRYNKNFVIVHCTDDDDDDDVVVHGGLALRELHHVIYIHAFPANEMEKRRLLASYCREAFSAIIFKVLIILPDFGDTRRYYQCQLYPLDADDRPYRSRIFSEQIFTAQFHDMHGATIWTQPDQLAPRTMLELDDDDDTSHMLGYVGLLLRLYAQRRNATLRYRFRNRFRKVVFPEEFLNALQNGSLDIVAVLSLGGIKLNTVYELTYPYDVDSYCFMFPLSATLPLYKVPFNIVSVPVLCIIALYMLIYGCLLLYSISGSWQCLTPGGSKFLIFFEMLRAMLAQSFTMVSHPRPSTKFLYFLISFTCYLVANMYLAFLQSFLTHPPTLPAITNWNQSDVKIIFPKNELKYLNASVHEFMHENIIAIDNYLEFIGLRNKLDIRYIYPVTSRRWEAFNEQQKFFKHRVFYYSRDLCVIPTALMTVPHRMGLPYKEVFDQFILRVQAAGLLSHWCSWNFYTMRRLGIITTEDLSVVETTGEAINLNDLHWIWIGYACLMGFSIVVFCIEVGFKVCTKKKASCLKNS